MASAEADPSDFGKRSTNLSTAVVKEHVTDCFSAIAGTALKGRPAGYGQIGGTVGPSPRSLRLGRSLPECCRPCPLALHARAAHVPDPVGPPPPNHRPS